MPTRVQRKAAIRRAAQASRRAATAVGEEAEAALRAAYEQAAADLQTTLTARADADGRLRLAVRQQLLADTEARMASLATQQERVIEEAVAAAARAGVAPLATELSAAAVATLPVAAVRSVRSFVAADGLQLSDRLWRLRVGAARDVATVIERAIIEGHGASEAAAELLAANEPVPAELLDKQRLASASRAGRQIQGRLLTDTGERSAYANARRVARTELTRAHSLAFEAAANEVDGVVGMRYRLSPAHPAPDICDLHASANLYGLGDGVYPRGKAPFPAHPNTLSYLEPVFADEVSDADRAGRRSRLDWLAAQPPALQAAVLGSRGKAQALRDGRLRQDEITTPWHVVRRRLERRA